MLNSSALGILIAKEPQVLALQKLDLIVTINYTNTKNHYI